MLPWQVVAVESRCRWFDLTPVLKWSRHPTELRHFEFFRTPAASSLPFWRSKNTAQQMPCQPAGRPEYASLTENARRQEIQKSIATLLSCVFSLLLPVIIRCQFYHPAGVAVAPLIVSGCSCIATGVTASRSAPETLTTSPTSRSPSETLSPMAISGAVHR